MKAEANINTLIYTAILDILCVEAKLATMWSWVEHNSLIAKHNIVLILALGRLNTHANTARAIKTKAHALVKEHVGAEAHEVEQAVLACAVVVVAC